MDQAFGVRAYEKLAGLAGPVAFPGLGPLEQGPCRAEPFCNVYRRLEDARQAWLTALESYWIGQIGDEYRRFDSLGEWVPLGNSGD